MRRQYRLDARKNAMENQVMTPMKPDNCRDERFRQELVLALLPNALDVLRQAIIVDDEIDSSDKAKNLVARASVDFADAIIKYMNKTTPQDGREDTKAVLSALSNG